MSSHRGRFRSFASVVVAFYAVAVPVFGSGTTDDLEPQVWEQSHSQMESDRLEFRHSAEDGLEAPFSTALVGSLIPGEQSRLAVSWEGVETELTAWVDFDGDGEFAYETERIITKAVMHEGMQAFEFEVPLWAKVDTDARVRFSVGAIWTVDERWKQLPQTHADCKANEASSPVCSWEGDFWLTDLNNAVHSLAVFDDGNGEALYAGGLFQAASGEKVGSIAKWDGASWSSLPGLYGVDPSVSVYTLAVFDDGNGEALYAGGDFTTANGATVNRVARWDGTSWSTLSGPSGIGLNEPVHKLAVYDDGNGEALYAGGEFTSAGGVTVNRIAKWDGTSWSALSGPSGAGVSDSVYGLAVYDDGNGAGLYAGGAFTTASGVTANRIARWDGTSWSALSGPSGTGVNDAVYELAVYDDGNGEALYTGGGFTSAGGVTVNRIAKWDGVSWSALSGPSGTGVNDAVYELAVYDDGNGEALYAGGGFTSAGGVTVNHIAKWDGTSWSALSGPSGTGVTTSSVMAMTVFNNGSVEELYAGGNFTLAGGVPANYIAKWDGASWSALSESSGGGLTTTVRALEVYDDGNGEALYAGGGFTSASGSIVNYIAKWDGASWSALFGPSGTGVDDTVRALAVFDDGNGEALYVGGSFITAGGLTVNRIAKWDGASWSPLTGPSGTGASSSVSSLAVFDDGNGEALYAGGSFTTAGGVTVNGVGKWDGASWSALTGPAGTGVSTSVSSLAVFDDGNGEALYAGGGFTTAGGVTVNNIAKWDGASWSALTGPTGTGVSNLVLALTVHDDGDGEALYVGGDFTSAGYMWVGNIAKWDGVSWSALSSGLNNRVYALAAFDDGSGEALYAGGSFTEAGASHIAKWVCDKEPPGTVSDLFSPSHPLSTPTANETIDMTWTAATDNVGVVGYGYEFSASSSWTCDQAQDTAGTSATSLPLSDGAWYFHICAADDVGNWGAVISAGRYWVDMTGSIVFLDGFESGDTSAWSSTVP